MNIIAIYHNMPSAAALFTSNKLVGAIQEERFTRVKNDSSFPLKSVQYLLESHRLTIRDIDVVVLASKLSDPQQVFSSKHSWPVSTYVEEQKKIWRPRIFDTAESSVDYLWQLEGATFSHGGWGKSFADMILAANDPVTKFHESRIGRVKELLGFPGNVVEVDHHMSHVFYTLGMSNFPDKNLLCLTLDAFGDGLNYTVGTWINGIYKRESAESSSIVARIYRYVTLILGMKPNEHEYKVMGLAPYASHSSVQEVTDFLKSICWVDGTKILVNPSLKDCYYSIKDAFEGYRFDSIAGGLQFWVEELLDVWVGNCISKYGIGDVIFSGGVAMNVKANGVLAKNRQVDSITVAGSSSDDCLAIGAGFLYLYEQEKVSIEPISSKAPARNLNLAPLYLGYDADEDEIDLAKWQSSSGVYFDVIPYSVSAAAKLLADGAVLGRCVGKMEFGQRSLGNRSILADPSKKGVVQKINATIKNRDFWMPFAPTIIDSFAAKYLIDGESLNSEHMALGFDTTPIGRQSMPGAVHMSDKTARPQILKESDNPRYYRLLIEFSEVTGRGALLNTSFNLHGYPIVMTKLDALTVYTNSQLDGLMFNDNILMRPNWKNNVDL
ncbi:hypothetical protein OA099_04340 [Litorivicinus sp.]|nr:hypothetical protein [Litorivicinus sp.]